MKWLKEIRNSLGLTQKEAAEMIGISRAYYISIETRGQVPPVKTAKLVANAMGFNWTKFYE